MGGQCNYCLAENQVIEKGVGLIGFSPAVQSAIDGFRQKNSDHLNEAKDHRISKGVIYRGVFEEGKKHGYGQFFNQTNAFFGRFQNDLPEGQGLLVRSFTDFIKGNFNQGKLHGEGRQKTAEIDFTGKFQMGERLSGLLITDLYTYEGDFSENKFNGYGRLEFKNGNLYQGYFKNGVYHGDGKYQTQAGVYNGEFIGGKYEGRGIYRWKDGSYYDGEYRNGQRNGFGRLVKGQFTYEGFWANGQPQSKQKLLEDEESKKQNKREEGMLKDEKKGKQ